MAVTTCLTGPPFSLEGESLYSSANISFSLQFLNSADAASVKAYEWYLNGLLVIDNNRNFFSGTVPCGSSSTIGVRILSDEGWSGVKYRQFITCEIPEFAIEGPEFVGEGDFATFSLIATFSDGRTENISSYYNFSSTEGGFSGTVLSIPANPAQNSLRQITITATRPGFPSVTRQVTVFDSSQSTGFPYNLPIPF